MNCDVVKERIYHSVYVNIKPFDVGIIKHLAHCQDCKTYHTELQYAKLTTDKLSQQLPVVDDPQELTINIMEAIEDQEVQSQRSSLNTLFWVKRILAAASVLLLIMFSYEQTVVTDKLIKLEEQMSASQGIVFETSHTKRLLNYYPTQGMDVIKTELAFRNIVLTDKNLASLFLREKSIALSPEKLSNRLKYQFVHLRIPNQKINVINALKK